LGERLVLLVGAFVDRHAQVGAGLGLGYRCALGRGCAGGRGSTGAVGWGGVVIVTGGVDVPTAFVATIWNIQDPAAGRLGTKKTDSCVVPIPTRDVPDPAVITPPWPGIR
jgi:hypothetical protein